MKKAIILSFSFSLFSIGYSFSQTWNGSVSSNWNTTANWTPGAVPTSGSTVIINNSSAAYQPELPGNVNIAALNMVHGTLNLNGNTLTCSGNASLTGDSLINGKIVAANFTNVANMRMNGKIIFQKEAAGNSFWDGGNKLYGDSLVLIWKTGTLHLQSASAAPDSVFGNLRVELADNYGVEFSLNSMLYVRDNMVLDNKGNGTFSWANSAGNTVIGGNLLGQNFTNATPNLLLKNIITSGNNANGPFYSHNASIDNCNFNGDFTLVADSNVVINIHNSSILGADNLFQAGNLDVQNSKFGKTGNGSTILRAAHNLGYNVLMRDGNNKFFGDAQWETYAIYPGGLTIQQNFYGVDSCWGNMNFILKGNSALTTNGNGNNYVAGNLLIDAQGASKWVQFTGGSGNTFTVGGNFTVKNFTPTPLPGAPPTNVYLRNLFVNGTDTCGTFYCYAGDINGSSFNGNFKLIADSSQTYFISNSSFPGDDNLFQAGNLDVQNSKFGKTGNGSTILRAAHNLGYNVLMRDGNNKFFGDAQWETYAIYPGGLTIQQNFYGADSCWGNMNFILKGNSALTTNGNGNNYVAGNLFIDAQGASKWVQFTGGSGNTFTVGGNFTVKNFTPTPLPGVAPTNVYLRNLNVNGTDTCGTFYCHAGDINGSSFNGNFKLIADSSQTYFISNSSFPGDDNLFQAGNLEVQNNKFGKTGNGSTILRAAHNLGYNGLMRDGNNKFFGDAQWETYAIYPGGLTIQQNFYGADSCWGNMNFILKGNSALTTNGNGNNYVAGNLLIDAQGASKWVQFTGGSGNTFTVGGNFTVKNFTPTPLPGAPPTNVYLRNLFVNGTDTCGTFYCYAGDINGSSFNGNFKLIADSSQVYSLNNSLFLGTDNYFQSGNLDVENSRFGKSNFGATILKAAHNIAGGINLRDGNNVFLGDAEWQTIAPSKGAILFQQTFFGPDSCLGNLTINVSGASSANLGGNNLYIGKGLSLQNNGSGTIVHNTGNSAIYFIGSDTASYSYGGNGSVPSLQNIGIDRRGGLRLASPLNCAGLILTRGIILSSPGNLLQMPNVAVVVGGGDSSYVDGPMQKTGNTAFTFSLGRNNIYAPLSITAPASATDAFTAQYFDHPAQKDGYDTLLKDASLNHVSRSEYWTLTREGTSPVNVTLSWKTLRSGLVTSMSDLRVAHWNGSMWKDEGNGSTTGSNSEGTVQSLNTISSFSPFTLASINTGNPLPLRYISFDAQLNSNRSVLLQWKISSEINNDHFEIERSKDGSDWISLATVISLPSHKYLYTDLFPTNGLNYYRIKETDVDGKYFYSEIRTVRLASTSRFSIWPNPAHDHLFVQIPFSEGSIEITDVSGKMLWRNVITDPIMSLPVRKLNAGIYILRMTSGNEKIIKKFMKE